MRYVLSLALLALPASALAEDGTTQEVKPITETDKAVIGGAAAPAGKWPDATALLWGSEQACTGTLIAPTVVLTAGHCVAGGAPNAVRLNSISDATGGETINVIRNFEYPSSESSVDAGVLVLAQPATVAPRAIATGWARFDITNGASIQLVGFGTIDRDGTQDTTALMEATTTITDFNCTSSPGCNSGGRPDGELGAGGNGIDTCPGDSGGPLYLTTSYGTYLAGITSRSYTGSNYYCSEGGIYARADKVVAWVEEKTGLKVTRGPEPTGELITVVRGNAAETPILHNDPKGTRHTYELVTQMTYGVAAVSDSGTLRVCPNDNVVGGDTVVVKVTDQDNPARSVTASIPVLITDGEPADGCDPTAFGEGNDGGGCCDTRRSARGSLALALIVGLALRRRRRTR
jgi:secreted trypsin-like serine protease